MATAIDLGHRAGFRLGAVEISPATCDVFGPGGRETVEPRVMQVLVALADADGQTVTRDDLMAQGWGDRVVGDDSLNRIILKIRRLAANVAAGSFTVKTIHKVGYRLLATEGQSAGPPTPAAAIGADMPTSIPSARKPRPGLRVLAIGGLVLLLIGSITWPGFDEKTGSQAAATRAPAELDPEARDLASRGRAAVFEGTPAQLAQGIAYFREALARAPDNPDLWGTLAMASVLDLKNLPPAEQAQRELRIGQAARRALALSPRDSHSWGALAYLQRGFGNWSAKEAFMVRALAAAEPDGPAPRRLYALLLADVGRMAEALRAIERVAAVNPLVPFIQAERVTMLAANDRLDEAEQAVAEAQQLWPRSHDLWLARFFLFALNGKTDAAIAMARDRATWPAAVREADMALLARSAAAIASGAPADADAVLADYARLAPQGQVYGQQAIRVATALDRPEAALRFADALYAAKSAPAANERYEDHVEYARAGERSTAALFLSPSQRLWREPGFMPLMAKIGLVDYWRKRSPPDFCRTPEVRETCRRYGLPATVRPTPRG